MKKIWHKEIITKEVENALSALTKKNLLRNFYLVGGTGMALHFGHRRSVDLDLFTKSFDEHKLLRGLQRIDDFSLLGISKETVHSLIRGIKVSFLAYSYPLLFRTRTFLGVKVADPRDIACMKISAISSRGTRRDFVDLYVAAKEYGLLTLLDLFKRKFTKVNYNILHVFKSLTYFEDAEKEPMPDMLVDISWRDVKQFFNKEVPRLM